MWQFSRDVLVGGETICVSTNAAEGLFGRVKKSMRERGTKPSNKYYTLLLSEYTWRQRHFVKGQFKDAPLWPLVDFIVKFTTEPGHADLYFVPAEAAQTLTEWRGG